MPWRPARGGVEIRVRVTPRGGRDAIDGIDTLSDGQRVVKVRVRAVPEDGAANDAVRRLLAETLRLPLSAVRLESGATARLKAFSLAGVAQDLIERLAAEIGPKP
jgi:uncharacterized protein YggU (UPF0235/DUF167 family)